MLAKKPGGVGTQAAWPVSGLENPMPHGTWVALIAVDTNDPGGAGIQDAEPVVLEKKPGAHGVHMPRPVTFAAVPTLQGRQVALLPPGEL